MTRFELIQLLVAHARSNGFQYRRWYVSWLGAPWKGSRKANELLSEERRYYSLLFSREFAQSFWKSGDTMIVQVPNQSFQRRMSDGTIGTVHRKSFTRRRTRSDAWQYHLQQMASAEDPLRYIRRFLRVEDELDVEETTPPRMLKELHDPRFILDEEDVLED